MNNIGVILPIENIKKERFERLEKLINYFFKKVDKIIYFSLNSYSYNYYKRFNIDTIIVPYKKKIFDNESFFLDKNIKNIVIIRDEADKNPPFEWLMPNINVFKEIMFGYGGLRFVSGLDREPSNVFIKSDGYNYFPYTFLLRQNVFNDENNFTFRMEEEFYRYKNRRKDHILVAIFGGSGAYDLVSMEPFSKKIEKKLNRSLKDKKITVLNFALCGGTILNEMIIYHLFVYELNPEIVMSYSGFNDFSFGQCNDRELVLDNIIYNPIYQQYADMVYKKDNYNNIIKNSAFSLIRAYYQRLEQFSSLVSKRGSKFISVLQPGIFSKSSLSEDEKFYVKINEVLQMKQALFNMKIIYEKYLYFLEDRKKDFLFINLHKEFYRFDKNHTLFADNVHLLPKGSDIVAEILSKHLLGVIDGL